MCSTNNCDSKVFETKIKNQWQFTAIPPHKCMFELLHGQNPNKVSHDHSKGTSQMQNQNVCAKVLVNMESSDF